MTLKSIHFRSYYDKNKEDHDIAGGLYLPCFEHSVLYRRATGYYRLSAMSCYLSAIPGFVRRGGKIQIVCSPDLKASDAVVMMKAIIDGEINPDLKKIYEDQILTEIESANEEEKSIDKIVSALMRLGVLEIKIAIPINGFFHKKLGYFEDVDGNKLTFSGSGNETRAGIDKNGNDEWIEVLTTWDQNNETTRARILMIDELWNKKTANTKVYDFPEAAQEQILNLTEDMANLSGEEGVDHLADLINEYERKKIVNESPVSLIPGVELRKHQQEAIKNWLGSGRRGIFDHCTGSGKTLTAVWLILDSLRRRETPLIIVPRKLLLDYWQEELRKYLPGRDVHIVLCGDNNNEWKRDLPLDICSKDRRNDPGGQFVIIAIVHTACSTEFQKRLQKGEHLFIIGDECHNYGSSKFSNHILTLECGPRLGLSATPHRHGDPEGAHKIVSYFGPVIEPVISISDGIKSRPPFLSSYEYYPHFCTLSDQEIERYENISKKIGALLGSNPDIDKKNSNLSALIAQRSKIWKKAESKIPLAVDIIKQHYKDNQKWLIFCEEEDQLRQLKNKLNEVVQGPLLEYLSRDRSKENHLNFFKHAHGILLAIRCLDEGVDIPDASHAIILASSQNSAQFIQRRGRVLRISKDKKYATIHDAFVLPPVDKKFERLIKGELDRGVAFANDALNDLYAKTEIKAKTYDYPIEFEGFRDKIGDFEEREIDPDTLLDDNILE